MNADKQTSQRASNAPESGIVAVFNHGRLKEDLIPLWAGEGDLPTPDFISQAASRALLAGETFYTWQRGIPELRQALARYHQRHFAQPFKPERFFVTGSGMLAIKLAIEATTDPGDEIIYLSPAWPNFSAALELSDGVPVAVQLVHADGTWQLDVDRIEKAVTPRTRALFVNTPSNPTGWVASLSDLEALRDLAWRHGLWIIADEIYSRFFYSDTRAPSFMDITGEDDPVLYVNTFSKNWSMTGWRIGWITAPERLGQIFENLIQYSTSGVPQFLQKGALAALDDGDGFVDMQIERARAARDVLCDRLVQTNRVHTIRPQGAFYAFFAIDGVRDTMACAKDIVDRAHVGLAPGMAFGPGGEGFLRACFLRRLDHVEAAADRLAAYIARL